MAQEVRGGVDWPAGLAEPATPLGRLQRGLGAGVRWALAGGDEARAALLRCLAVDARWDRQLDEQAAAYAELADALGVTAADLVALIDTAHMRQGGRCVPATR